MKFIFNNYEINQYLAYFILKNKKNPQNESFLLI
jgi:hypothetical protein